MRIAGMVNNSAFWFGTPSAAAACRKWILILGGSAVVCSGLALRAQTGDSQATDQSWTKSGESQDAFGSRRSVESHSQIGDRTIDKQSITERTPDGRYQTYLDTEKETVRVNASTVRTITRTYAGDGSGGRKLVQVAEEETQTLPEGGSKSVRTTSRTDANGNLQPVQRELAEKRKIGSDSEETKTTVSRPSVNGGFAPTAQIEERQQHAGNNTDFQKTTRTLDGSGNWQVSEVRKGTIKEDGKNRTREERVSVPDYEGRLTETSRTVTNELASESGEKQQTVESYSVDLPGAVRDGQLHMVKRETSRQSASSNGKQTSIHQVEQPNPGDPGAGMRVTIVSNGEVRSDSSGEQTTGAVQVRNASGGFNTVVVDMSKSDKANSVQVQISPSEKKK